MQCLLQRLSHMLPQGHQLMYAHDCHALLCCLPGSTQLLTVFVIITLFRTIYLIIYFIIHPVIYPVILLVVYLILPCFLLYLPIFMLYPGS